MKNNVHITIFKAEEYDGNDWPKNNSVDFISWLSDKVNLAPSEYKDNVVINLNSVSGYEECHNVEIEIYYTRPETDKEEEQRENLTKALEERKEKIELERYKRLKEKFEPDV